MADFGTTAASLIPSVFQGGMGIFQGLLSAFNKPQRPVAVVPESMKKATDVAENLAAGNMPGYANTKAQIDLAGGEAINAAKGSGNINSLVADILAKQNSANLDLGSQNAQFKANASQNYQGQLNREGQAEQSVFNYNNIDKYNKAAAANSALTQASTQNIFDSLNNISGTAAYNGLFNSLFGDKNSDTYGSNLTNAGNMVGASNWLKNFQNQVGTNSLSTLFG